MKTKTLVRLILFCAIVCQAMPMTVNNVGSLASSQKVQITYKPQASANLGKPVTTLGDINGDGISDFAIGAPSDNSKTGKVFVIYGLKGGLPNIDLTAFRNDQGFIITGGNVSDDFGVSVAALGDVNGDGISDFAIGADGYNSNNGIAYVIYGRSDSNQRSFVVSALTNTQGFIITGSGSNFAGSQIGLVVSRANDFDLDTINDILVSCPGYGGATDGRVFLVYGSSTPRSSLDLNGASMTDVMYFVGPSSSQFGASLSPAGDVNSDNRADFVAGAPLSASAIVFYGVSGRGTASINANSMTRTNGFKIYDSTSSVTVGSNVNGEGDLNADGRKDIIVFGSKFDTVNGVNGIFSMVYVIGGPNADGSDIDVSNLSPRNGIVLSSRMSTNLLGTAISAKGDINGDGIDDLILGAALAGPDSNSAPGAIYVLFGRKTGSQNAVIEDAADVVLYGGSSLTSFGASVAGAGDFNGDGTADVIVGAPSDNMSFGETYVVYGSKTFGVSIVTKTGKIP